VKYIQHGTPPPPSPRAKKYEQGSRDPPDGDVNTTINKAADDALLAIAYEKKTRETAK
jgi:hypothetical protein